MHAKLPGLWLCVLLAGCAAGVRQPVPRWDDPASERRLLALLCRLDQQCRWLRLRLYDSDVPLAEIRYRFEIVISRGLLERGMEEAEHAFVLAHELAHLRLDHRRPRNPEERLTQELAADAWAVRRLNDTGLDGCAGARLLQRLCSELAGGTPSSGRATAAQAEYAQRLRALAGIAACRDAPPAPGPATPCAGPR
jgi:hypothetical protein